MNVIFFQSVDEILAQNEIVREDPNKATVLETSLIKTVTPKVTKNATIISHYASLSVSKNFILSILLFLRMGVVGLDLFIFLSSTSASRFSLL